MATTELPNKYIGFPAVGDTGWGLVADASFQNIDSAFGGNQAFNLATASGVVGVSSNTYLGAFPANTASYVPRSWTLTGTLTANVNLQIPASVGGEWIVNNQCVMGAYTITFSAASGSTSTLVNAGTQSIYCDGLGNVSQAQTQTMSSSSANRIINSGLDIWQTGTGATIAPTSTQTYTAAPDQWQIYNSTSVSLTWARATAPSTFSNPGINAIQFTVTGMLAADYFSFVHVFDALYISDLDSQALSLSFDANLTTSAGTMTPSASFNANTAPNNSTWTNFLPTATGAPMTAGYQRVKIPLTATQTAGIKNGAQLVIKFTQSGATANITLVLSAFRLERGSVFNPWQAKPFSQEVSDCDRFFQSSYNNYSVPGSANTGSGYIRNVEATTTNATIPITFRTRMRTSPTVTLYSPVTGASGKIYNFTAVTDVAATIINSSPSPTAFGAAVNSVSVTAGQTISVHWTADARL